MRLRLGTRGSLLARTQAKRVVDMLGELGHQVEQVIVQTRGDADQHSNFPEFGGPGVFVRELEQALLERRVDLVVHSYKDVPSASSPALTIAAVPERLSPVDHLLIRRQMLATDEGDLPLPRGGRVGTSSARRRALLSHARPDLRIEPLRGNVDTRLRKLLEGQYDAIVLAAAGLQRLRDAGELEPQRFAPLHEHPLDPESFVPAPGQGALAVQVRTDDDVLPVVRALHQESLEAALAAERQLLELIQGNCDVPFGAWCRPIEAGDYALHYMIADGERFLRECERGPDPLQLAERARERIAAREMLPR